jgi:hypothetical protein
VLEPAATTAGTGDDKHRAKIRATLEDLDIAHDDAVAEFWLALAGQEPGSLPSRAHRPGRDALVPERHPRDPLLDREARVASARSL